MCYVNAIGCSFLSESRAATSFTISFCVWAEPTPMRPHQNRFWIELRCEQSMNLSANIARRRSLLCVECMTESDNWRNANIHIQKRNRTNDWLNDCVRLRKRDETNASINVDSLPTVDLGTNEQTNGAQSESLSRTEPVENSIRCSVWMGIQFSVFRRLSWSDDVLSEISLNL